jgi:phosphatidylglycerophosphate synthase
MMGYSFIAVLCLALSGFLDTLDGSIARHTQRASPKGAALDIISDRVVEFVIILSLFLIDPASRALPSLFMLGSVLICITSFLIVGIFTQNESQKSFHYSPGLMERAEAFIFFAAMILFPLAFPVLSALFSLLVAITALIHIFQFFHQSDII